VFRDESALSANPGLWSSIQSALDGSAWFVLLASPDAAASEWVNREVGHWIAHDSVNRMLIVVTDGTWEWNDGALSGTAVLPALRDAFDDEPLHVDLRWARDADDLDLRNARFRDAVAQLAAPVHGIPKDELESEDVRVHRRARRLARSAFSVLVFLLALAVVFGVVAVRERDRADDNAHRAQRQALVADVGRLGAEARRLVDRHLDLALLLAVEARRLDDSVVSRGALEAVLVHSARLERLIQFPTSRGAAVSPDGRLLAVDGPDGTVEVRRLPSGRVFEHLRLGTEPVGPLALSADGTLAVSHPDGTVDLRDVMTGAARGAPLTGNGNSYFALVFSPDGSRLAGTDLGGRGVIWDLGSSSRAAVFSDSVALVAPAWSPDSQTLATTATFGDLTLWDARTRRPKGPRLPVTGSVPLAFSPDGRLLAVGGDDSVSLFDVATRQLAGLLAGSGSVPAWLAFSPDGTTLARGDNAGSVVRWDLGTRQQHGGPLVGIGAGTSAAVLTADGRLVTLGPHTLGVWRPGTSEPALGHVFGTFAGLGGFALAPDGKTLLIGGNLDDRYALVDLRRGRRGRTRHWPIQGTIWSDAWSPDGTTFAVAYGDGRIMLVDSGTGAVRGALVGHKGPAIGVGFSPDGRRLAAGGSDGTVLVWDVASRRRVGRPLTAGPGAIWGVAFSPDGGTLAVASLDGTVSLYAATSQRAMHTFRVSQPVWYGLAFSPDGRFLAVPGRTGAILIDVATRSVGTPLAGHTASVFTVAFSHDGKTLVSTSSDGTAILYDVATRLPVGDPLDARYGGATAAELTPDDRKLVTGYYQGKIVLWDIDPDSWQRNACAIAGRNLTLDEWHQYLGERPYHETCSQWPEAT